MIRHIELGLNDAERRKNLSKMIHNEAIALGGHRKARIYGLLSCPSGKRMKIENRVFFRDETEAVAAGFRPCGRCRPIAYTKWKAKH